MKVIEKKYLLPFVLVTSLFALWGLANNMTDTLLAAFKRIMDMSDTQTSFIQRIRGTGTFIHNISLTFAQTNCVSGLREA